MHKFQPVEHFLELNNLVKMVLQMVSQNAVLWDAYFININPNHQEQEGFWDLHK